MSHNLHTQTDHQAITRDHHVFIVHSMPQLKECLSKLHTQGIMSSNVDHAQLQSEQPCPLC